MLARCKGAVPNTLHIYSRDRPTVSLGYFEKIEDTIDLKYLKEHSISVVRRITGGSTIYTDQGQLIYSLVVSDREIPKNPRDAFELVCGGIIDGLSLFDLKADYEPVNDVIVRGRKTSGSAQLRRDGAVLLHGTIILRSDTDIMFNVLRSPKRNKDQMTSLDEEIGRRSSTDEVVDALMYGLSRKLDMGPPTVGELTAMEEEILTRLVHEKYGTQAHTGSG